MVKANRALSGNRNATTPKVNARTPRTTNHPQLWLSSGTPVRASLPAPAWGTVADMLVIAWPPSSLLTLPEQRSEERRGGKEGGSTGRYRWWPLHSKTNKNSNDSHKEHSK